MYDAIGASDADGIGSSVECPPFTDCPNGMGYPQVATRQLKAQGFSVSLTNYGIPTAVIGPDFQLLGLQNNRTILGNLITSEMPFVRQTATLVTIFAGGNDINTITAALGNGAGGTDQAGYIDTQVKAFAADYQTLLNGIRGRAGSARIIAFNVPNLAGLPFLATASLAQRQAAQRAAVGMTGGRQRADVKQRHRRRPDVRRALVRPVELLIGRVPPQRRRLRLRGGRSGARRHLELVSPAAERAAAS